MLENKLSRHYWHMIAHRTELPANNDFLVLKWAHGDIVVFNDADDLIVFDNLCPHRGTRFFIEPAGNAPAYCPYHGWSYRNGEVRVPNPERFKPCDLTRARLNKFQVDWCGDFLFFAIEPCMSLVDQLGETTTTLEDISFNISGRSDLNQYDFECNWRIALENALEPYHIDLIHTDSLGVLKLQDGENKFYGLNSEWRAEVGDERLAKRLKTMRRLFSIDFQYEGYLSLYIFPYAMLSSTFGYSYSLQNFFPSAQAGHTHFASRLLTVPTPAASVAATSVFFESTAKVNRQVFNEDHDICRRVSLSALETHDILSETEEKVRHFRNALQQVRTAT